MPDYLKHALEMTGQTTVEELIDMANVGCSLMDAIALLDGPFKDWAPADDPAEIVVDLVNHYEDRLSRIQEENERLRTPLAKLVKCDDDARDPLQNGAGLLDCIDNHSQFYPSAELGAALVEARAALASQEQGGPGHG